MFFEQKNSQQTWMRQLDNEEVAVALMSTRTDIPVYMEFTFQQVFEILFMIFLLCF